MIDKSRWHNIIFNSDCWCLVWVNIYRCSDLCLEIIISDNTFRIINNFLPAMLNQLN